MLHQSAVSRYFLTLLWVSLCASFSLRAFADKVPTLQTPNPIDRTELVDKRDHLWRQATESAAKQNWKAAIRSGKAAFSLQSQEFQDQPLVVCQMLDSLSFWHSRAREFPAALAAARELLERRRMRFNEDYWQTVNARLNLALVERLSKLPDDQWQQFLEADTLNAEAVSLQREGKNTDAVMKGEQALSIYTNMLGRSDSITLICLANVVICHLELGQYFQAEPNLKELFEQQPMLKGTFHPDVVLTLQLGARFNEAVGSLGEAEDMLDKVVTIQTALLGPDHPDTLSARVDLGRIYLEQEKFAEAETLLIPALDKQRDLFGEDHLATAQTMKVLGTLRAELRKYDEAEKLLLKSVEVFGKVAGENHLATASAYNALGNLHTTTNQLKQADDDFRRSLKICLDQLGDQHPSTAKVLVNMGRLYEIDANMGLARQVRLQCLRIAEQTFGEMNVRTADALENVAGTFSAMNDVGFAELYLLRAREIRRKLLGEDDPKTARIVRQLACICLANGDFAEAEPLFNEALAVIEKSEGPDSAEAAWIHGQLGLLYQLTGRLEESETECQRAVTIYSSCHGPDHYLTAVVKGFLAQTMLSRGDCQEACRLIDESLDIYSQALKYNEPRWFDSLGIGARAHLAAGNTEKAIHLLKRGLHIAQLQMQMAGAYESERQRLQQMTAMREMLDLYLSLPLSLQTEGSGAYDHVFRWKGAIAARQRLDRQYVSEDTTPLVAELQQLCRRWATLQLSVPVIAERGDWTSEINRLKLRKEALEQQLADYRSRLQTPQEEVRLAEMLKTFSPTTALIDILQYTHTSFEKEDGKVQMRRHERFVAFVLHRYRSMQRIDLGEVEPIADAVAKWRKTRGFRPNNGKTDWAVNLGELLWPPLKPYLNDCDTLLISPDGVLSQLSWSVLPGRKPDSYLIEDFAIGMVPVPQLLAERQKPEQRTISLGAGLPVVALGDLPPRKDGVRSPKPSAVNPYYSSAISTTKPPPQTSNSRQTPPRNHAAGDLTSIRCREPPLKYRR